MATDMGTHASVLHFMLGGGFPVVEAILPLFDCIYRNRMEWVRLMAEQETMTWFTYDVLWIVSAYLNACILASMSVAEGGPGARTPVYFQYLINELNCGRYARRALPRSLQYLITVCVGRHAAPTLPPPAPRTIGRDGQARGGGGGGGRGGMIIPRGRRLNDRGGEVIPNPCPIQRLRILSG